MIKKVFDWNLEDFIKTVFGMLIMCLAINLFIRPVGLYNGGILGITQLINTFTVKIFKLNNSFNISGILYFLLNIPLLIISKSKVNNYFLRRTILCVIIQTLFLSIIPIPKKPFVDDILTSTLIGGFVAGYGCGMFLSTGSSAGGTDIIGVIMSLKSRKFTVGKLSFGINFFIYLICGLCFGIKTMIYSFVYSFIATFVVDRTHEKNICSTAVIFTKNEPTIILDYIKNELKRDATYWKGIGGYNKTTSYITYVALSKYELSRLEKDIIKLDNSAFIIKNNGVGIDGNFELKI